MRQPFQNLQSAYQLHYHFCFDTYRNQPVLGSPEAVRLVLETHQHVCHRNDYHILETEVLPNGFLTLLSLRPTHRVSEAAKVIKGNIPTAFRNAPMRPTQGLLGGGYFVRSTGKVTNDVIRYYVESQFVHHRIPISSTELASYHNTQGDPSELRRGAHTIFELNYHFVFVTQKRGALLDPEVAQSLVNYTLKVAEKKRYIVWDFKVLEEHVHLFVGLRPADDIEQVALSLLNNWWYFLWKRHRNYLVMQKLENIWQTSYYVGTIGSATTAQIKAFLRRGSHGRRT